MVNVFITVDTEAWPCHDNWLSAGLSRDIDRDVYGKTSAGEFGVGYQIDVLNAHNLKAIFFVEALGAPIFGSERLKKLVDLIQSRGHEVQLHLHTEWLKWLDPSPLPGRTGRNIKDFSVDEQTVLLSCALENLRAAGAVDICAFRAGNYGANLDTLRALARVGIRHDTSHNSCYLDSDCGMGEAGMLLQPKVIHDVLEHPISFFQVAHGWHRHAQLCACSAAEMRHALLGAWRQEWHSFVIVSHSFEMIRGRKQRVRPLRPDRIVVRRFEKLCGFLADNRDKFRTRGFCELNGSVDPPMNSIVPLRSGIHRTALRIGEQLLRRII